MMLPARFTNGLDQMFSRLLWPFSKSSHEITLAATDKFPSQPSPTVSFQKYQQLENELIYSQSQLRKIQKINNELAGLRRRFALDRVDFITAYIIGSDSSTLHQVRKLDQGADHYVARGQMVLAAVGKKQNLSSADKAQLAVVGKISEVGSQTASLQLLTDPGFILPVIIQPRWDRKQNWRARGVLQSIGMHRIVVTMVSTKQPVKVGDIVLARAGKNSSLTTDILLGTVRYCRPDDRNPVMWRIQVQPAVDLPNLRQVVVIRNPKE